MKTIPKVCVKLIFKLAAANIGKFSLAVRHNVFNHLLRIYNVI